MTSCDDFLDSQPQDKVIPTTIEEFDMLLRGGSMTLGFDHVCYMDDDIRFTDTRFKQLSTNYFNAYTWQEYLVEADNSDSNYKTMYGNVYICNVVLDRIDDAEGDDKFYRNQVKGQALMNRAYYYLALTSMYAKHYNPQTIATDLGVAMPLTPDIEQKPARVSVKEVYQQILSDLHEGAELLPDMVQQFPLYNYLPSKAGAYGLLSRVYLYMGNWEKAKEFGEKCLNLHTHLNDYNPIELVDEADKGKGYVNMDYLIPNENQENIWLKYTYARGSMYVKYAYYTEDLLSVFDKVNDLRYYLFANEDADGVEYVREFNGMYINLGISVPEVILNVAEACARLNESAPAMDYLNTLRQKRYNSETYVALTATSGEEALDHVLLERRRELAFRGFRFFDQKRFILEGRYDQTVVRQHGEEQYELTPNSNRYVLPIPVRNLNLNENLVQNPR